MKSSKINKPKILLVGVGHFGIHHLNNLKELDKEGKIEFFGALAHSKKDKKTIQNAGVNVFSVLSDDLLNSIDAVDIVTPASTHSELVKKCLPFTNVFLEKPIALSVDDGLALNKLSKKEGNFLFLGHIYRFNSAVIKLKELILNSDTKLNFIECIFEDKPEKVTVDCSILYSDLHGFDIIDYLIGLEPITILTKAKKKRQDSVFEDEAEVMLEYNSDIRGKIKLSWNTLPKERKVKVSFSDKIIEVDLISQDISIKKNGNLEKIKGFSEMPLALELEHFVKVLKGDIEDYPDASVGTRIVNIAAHAEESLHKDCIISYKKYE